jgi:disulfide oxidoreductase YuzD
VAYYLRQKFGENITTKFVNLAVPEARHRYANVVASIEKDNLPLPLVAINGEVKMAGGVDYLAIVSAIESHLADKELPSASMATPPFS